MNKQDMFDVMTSALLAQGKQSGEVPEEGADFECRYRAPDGCKCAVGHLIKDEFYNEGFEGSNMCATTVINAVEKSLGVHLTEHDIDFLQHVQEVHDNTSPETWDSQFRKVACDWALEYKGEQF